MSTLAQKRWNGGALVVATATEIDILRAQGKKRCPRCKGVFNREECYRNGYCKSCGKEAVRQHRAAKRNNPRFGIEKDACPGCGKRKFVGRELCRACLDKRGYYCACGAQMSAGSRMCRACAGKATAEMQRRERGPELPRNPFCPTLAACAECESFFPHRHCECGWPIKPDALFCHICLHEQSRVEHKRLAIEEAA